MSLATTVLSAHHPAGERLPLEPKVMQPPEDVLESERVFYQGYTWCLNPFPTIRETIKYLGREIDRLTDAQETWQTSEVMTNVYLLSCALLNAVDDYLRGKTLRIPRKLSAVPLSGSIVWAMETLGAIRSWRRRRHARRWRERWLASLDQFLRSFIGVETLDPSVVARAGNSLALLLQSPLPVDLQAEHIYFPSAFRRLDLTHFDVLALGRDFVSRFPDRLQPILILGLRTAGSYFAPLLRAFLGTEGYRTVTVLTVQPEKGLGAGERAELTRCGRAGYLAAILDDPPHTGDTIALTVSMARKAGFASGRMAVLVPAHPARRDWSKAHSFSDTVLLSLDPEQWHKQRLLEPKVVERRLTEYFQSRQFSNVSVVASSDVDQFNAQLQSVSEDVRRTRLKRIYEVRLQTPDGEVETRHVLAKSVGWGWLGYHAFLAGYRLAGFVPAVLGLRDGILYTQWLPQQTGPDAGGSDTSRSLGAGEREAWIETAASYVAARARVLSLGENPFPSLGRHRHLDGFQLLEKVLGRAAGRFLTASLMRPRIRHRLSSLPCPFPTLIDGKMQRSEWIAGPQGLLKTDFEHHGMGKNELNAIDPAYDLAETILQLRLSPGEEGQLIQRYAEESGDTSVDSRLYLNKFLAGTWAMASALKSLYEYPSLTARQQEFHQQFVSAVHFLTVHTARFCGRMCSPPKTPTWRSRLAVLDIDGVVDRQLFGFPCTTAAGVQALCLLHTHEFAIAVDTARSVAEVQEYCRAYGLVGGVAEYGAYVWDAVSQRGQGLVSPESLRQLDQARKALAQLPGVFLDDRYQYSIRAYTYEDKGTVLNRLPIPSPLRAVLSVTSDEKAPVPLPTLTVQHLLASLGLDRLCFQQTTIDTTIRAKEVDKGSGLLALLNWTGLAEVETIAVGDSEPDLPMFRVATRSYAPAQIGCARQARSLGCRIAREPYQRGLLSIVRSVIHADGGRCKNCPPQGSSWPTNNDLFLDLLQIADCKRSVGFVRALLDPKAYELFAR
jgi:hydroxymethylpyrimidine pyrophosphatase-like HAD family hydrolase